MIAGPRSKVGKGSLMRLYKSTMAIAAAALIAFVSTPSSYAFSIKGSVQTEDESSEINNKKLQRAAVLEAKAYICGTDSEASAAVMKAGMAETGLPEDIAIEVVSDLASGIIDRATKTGSKEICGKAEVELSKL